MSKVALTEETSEILRDLINLLTVETLLRIEEGTPLAESGEFAAGVEAARAFIGSYLLFHLLGNLPEITPALQEYRDGLEAMLVLGDTTLLHLLNERDDEPDASRVSAAEEVADEELTWSESLGVTGVGTVYMLR
jgi:hypothetical protein